MARRAKIVCTLGPASEAPDAIRRLVDAGMDVARLNFSHGTREQHAGMYQRVREASDASGRAVGVLADLQGPKIRLGTFHGGSTFLEPGSVFTVTTEPFQGTSERASTTYGELADDVSEGDTILLDDGLLKLKALSSNGREVSCQVLEGGPLSDHKGINLPRANVRPRGLTEKDADDLAFSLNMGADIVALSFVRYAAEAEAARAVMDACGRRVPVIAKVEKPEAVDDLEAIVDHFDGVMVARGDLGVEMQLEQVPFVQKRAVDVARVRSKPVVVASQMLHSMTEQFRPTRAEVSDVANAVLDGADALMLSGETSVGTHPATAVATMSRIVEAAEHHEPAERSRGARRDDHHDALAKAATGLCRAVGGRALVAFTQTGATARRLASHRPQTPVLAFTPEPAVRSQLSLTWGVETFIVPEGRHGDQAVDETMLGLGRADQGDPVVIVAGTPGRTGTTDSLRIHRLGSR